MYMSVNKLPQWLCLSFSKGKEVSMSSVTYNRKAIMTELAAQGPARGENPDSDTPGRRHTPEPLYWLSSCPLTHKVLPKCSCSQGKILILYLQNYTIPTAFWGGRDEEGSNEKPPPVASKRLQSNRKKKRQLEGV